MEEVMVDGAGNQSTIDNGELIIDNEKHQKHRNEKR